MFILSGSDSCCWFYCQPLHLPFYYIPNYKLTNSNVNWPKRNIHISKENGSFTFYVDLYRTKIYKSNTVGVLWEANIWVHPRYFVGSMFWCVVCFVFGFVPNVACVSRLFILDCPSVYSNVFLDKRRKSKRYIRIEIIHTLCLLKKRTFHN